MSAGWLSEVTSEVDGDAHFPTAPWTPFLHWSDSAMCLPLRIGFSTKAECDDFIRDVLGGDTK